MKKAIMVMLFSVFLLSAMAVLVMPQATVGVAVDDWFYYTIETSQTSNSTGTWWVPNIIGTLEIGGTTHNTILNDNYVTLNRTVTAVDGTNVTFREEWTMFNGTVVTQTDVVANITECNLFWAIIPANLETDDTLTAHPTQAYPQGGTFYINSTESRTYAGETREACTVDYWYKHTNYPTASFNASYSWDQTTGILVDSNMTTYFFWSQDNSLTTTIFLFELYASSEWIVVPEFSNITVMLLVLVAATVCVDIYRRKKLKH